MHQCNAPGADMLPIGNACQLQHSSPTVPQFPPKARLALAWTQQHRLLPDTPSTQWDQTTQMQPQHCQSQVRLTNTHKCKMTVSHVSDSQNMPNSQTCQVSDGQAQGIMPPLKTSKLCALTLGKTQQTQPQLQQMRPVYCSTLAHTVSCVYPLPCCPYSV
jgi:hypothetical protein